MNKDTNKDMNKDTDKATASPPQRLRIALPREQQEDETVAAALRWLAQHRAQQPSLPVLAQALGISPFVLQKRFTRWAGVSPKDFLALLNAKVARQLLRQGASILDASLEMGLSSPSRLHDLFVRIEALTPGDYKRQGEDLTLFFGSHNSPFGKAHTLVSARGLCALGFHGERASDARAAKHDFQQRWPKARIVEDASKTKPYAEKIFPPSRQNPKKNPEQLSLHLLATPFRLQVWRALLDIPMGRCKSYGTLGFGARYARAVGNAVGSNPVAFLIPCHRVIRQSGALGGYYWGIDKKIAMLGCETATSPSLSPNSSPATMSSKNP